MTNNTYHEYRIFYGTDNVFTCFARHLGEAIEQLNEFYGDSFTTNIITGAKASIKNAPWENIDLPKSWAISL